MLVLVTGATGRVGRLVVDELLHAGVSVRALTRRPEQASLPAGVEVVAGDLTVPESLDAGLATLFIPVSNGLSWLRATGRLQPGESVVVLGVGQHGLASVAAARSRPMTRSRCSWLIPPCSASARWPRPLRLSVRWSTSARVRQKTIAAVGASMSRIRPSTADLCARATT